MAKDTPRIICNRDNSEAKLLAAENQVLATIGSTAWLEWLENNRAFQFEPQSFDMELLWNFSAQKEKRKDGFYWIAYKRFKGKLERMHLGVSQDLNLEKLLDASKKFPTKFQGNSTTAPQPSEDDIDTDVDPNPGTDGSDTSDSEMDDPTEPSSADVIRSQATKIQSLQSEVSLLEREKAELRSQLDETAQLAELFEVLQIRVAALALEDAQLREQVEELQVLKEGHNQTQSQLGNQARLAGEWYEKAKAAEAELEQLRSQPVVPMVVDPEVIDLLRGALNLKANAGGAIKRKIEQALVLLTGADSQ